MGVVDIELGNLLAAVQAEARMQAAGSATDVELRVGLGVPRRVRLDGESLRRLLLLLVARAVRATPRGSVVVGVEHEPRADLPEQLGLRFRVQDDGPVRPPDLTDPFAVPRVDGRPDLDAALWEQLVPCLAEEWGERAEPGAGTTRWFALTAQRAAPAPDGGDHDVPTVRVARVLVVEDNLVNQKVAAKLLERMGCQVDVVGDGAQAVASTERQRYDLVLMDCQMPVMDGYEATAEIRRREGCRPHTPIVALTAHAMDANRRRCLDVGMDDFVAKPVTRDVLERVVARWLEPGARRPTPSPS